jgi:hypothetical protein
MLDAYSQVAPPTMFLSGFFKSPARNFHSSEEVEIDIVRSGREISIAIQSLAAGYRENSKDLYTNKSFKPPIHKESFSLDSATLIKRMPGQNPFESPNFRANAIVRMMEGMQEVDRKIRRSIELQSSQVLQTGVVTLVDSSGNEIFGIDYKPKATHFPTSALAWDAVGNTKLADLEALADAINDDGLTEPTDAIFGADAWNAFIRDEGVQALLDNRRMVLGGVAPEKRNGAKFMGMIELGSYRVNMWTYNGKYDDPQTSNVTRYISPEKVVMLDSEARLDATFGAIPNIGRELGITGAGVIPELPSRFSNVEGGMDLFTNAWITPDGENLFGGVGARPLMIPTAIDTFGCLDTGL